MRPRAGAVEEPSLSRTGITSASRRGKPALRDRINEILAQTCGRTLEKDLSEVGISGMIISRRFFRERAERETPRRKRRKVSR